MRYFFILSLLIAQGIAAVSAAQNGLIIGSTPKAKKFVAATTRAYSLESTALFATEVSANRSYKLSVPAGAYVVISDVTGKKEKLSAINVVSVTKGKKTNVKVPARRSSSASPEIRVSVGNVLLKTADGNTVKATNGKNITIDDLLIVDLLNSKNDCKFAIVEDRIFGRFKDVLKELRLQSSKFSAQKLNYKAALSSLNNNAPQFRLTGSVEVNQQQDLTGNASLQIVKINTGEVIWQKSFSNIGTNFANFTEPLAQAAADAICIPQQISGSFSGKQISTGSGFSVNYSWIGNATFKFQSYIAEDPSKPENLSAALYQLTSAQISSYSVDGVNNGCTVTGAVSSLVPDTSAAGLLVYLNPTPGLGYKYLLSISLLKQNAILITTSCPKGDDSRLDIASAELVTSQSDNAPPRTLNLNNYSGSITVDDTEMTWDFSAQL
jgi:hypothetical protein